MVTKAQIRKELLQKREELPENLCEELSTNTKWQLTTLGRTAKQGIFLRVLSVGNRIVSASSDTMAVRYRQTCRTT